MNDMIEQMAQAIGNAIYGHCDPINTPDTWAKSLAAAGAVLETVLDPVQQKAVAELSDSLDTALAMMEQLNAKLDATRKLGQRGE